MSDVVFNTLNLQSQINLCLVAVRPAESSIMLASMMAGIPAKRLLAVAKI
jgi:hypothetical protein